MGHGLREGVVYVTTGSDCNHVYTMSDVFPPGSAHCMIIPIVPDFVWGDWVATEHAMTAGLRLAFGQPWRKERDADFKPGYVWLGVVGDALLAYSVFADDEPRNTATRWNDPTWMKGDVIELFFQAEGRAAYHEFHVTPENHRLQLCFPSTEAFRAGYGHKHWAIAEPKFEHVTRINATRTQWECVMRIPLALVLDAPRADASRRFRFSISRYDYQPGRAKPVTSATSALSSPDFHNIPEWSWAEAARG